MGVRIDKYRSCGLWVRRKHNSTLSNTGGKKTDCQGSQEVRDRV